MAERGSLIVHAVVVVLVAAAAIAALVYFVFPGLFGGFRYPSNPQRFITPSDYTVSSLAAGLAGPEACHDWVAQNVVYTPDNTLGREEVWFLPSDTLVRKTGDCEDFATLLCSLIRAKGVPASDVRVVVGTLQQDGEAFGHAWVELKHEGDWLPLEPTATGDYPPPFDYYETHAHPEVERYYWFNDVSYEKLAG